MLPDMIDLIDVQFDLAHDCIRACVYGDHIARTTPKKDGWWPMMDMCYSDAVISWNAIFGSNKSQKAHWKGFVTDLAVPARSNLRPFGSDMIVKYLDTTHEQWDAYHKELVNYRNHRLAHFDLGVAKSRIPVDVVTQRILQNPYLYLPKAIPINWS